MSNSTNPELVGTLKDSFLNWFQHDIFPYFEATFDIITIIIGFTLNVILIVTFKKRGLFKEPSSHFVLMLSISDFVAFPLVLLPTIITAFARAWILPLPICFMHGCIVILMLYASFLFLTTLGIERTMKLTHLELYRKTFESKTFVNIVTVVIWIFSTAVSFATIAGLAEIKYDASHQGCVLNYLTSYWLLNVHFVTTFGISFVVMIVCYSLIFEARRRALKETQTVLFKPNAKIDTIGKSTSMPGKRRKLETACGKQVNILRSVSESEDSNVNTEETSEKASGTKEVNRNNS